MPFLYSCQVRKGLTMGSCFLPPFSGTFSGIPSGCGSCVSQCSNGKGPSTNNDIVEETLEDIIG